MTPAQMCAYVHARYHDLSKTMADCKACAKWWRRWERNCGL